MKKLKSLIILIICLSLIALACANPVTPSTPEQSQTAQEQPTSPATQSTPNEQPTKEAETTSPATQATPTQEPVPQPTTEPTPTQEPTSVPEPTSRPELISTPETTPISEPSPVPDIQITRIFYDGLVPSSESDEYVEITNVGTEPANLAGWVIKDIDEGYPSLTFPSYILDPGQSVRVYTNEIHPEYGGFSFGSRKAVWNNSSPDTAALYNPQGLEVSRKSY